jgi:hypothetical protein
MTEGDTVIFSAQHHEWLVKAGKWPSKHVPREAHKGEVLEVRSDGVVYVLWHDRAASHLPENLEVVR